MSAALVYWHGGPRIVGDRVLPSSLTGSSRSGDAGVHVTTDRSLAEAYARAALATPEPLG